jgi:hypothetical protein
MVTDEHPIEYEQQVVVGRNPNNELGYWLTEHEAVWFFARQFEEFLKDSEGKLLFIRRAPKLESYNLFDMDKPVYSMVGRFSIGELKENTCSLKTTSSSASSAR